MQLGLQKEKASMMWVDCRGSSYSGPMIFPGYRLEKIPSTGFPEDNIPAFTALDLLNVMPDEIKGDEICLYKTLGVWWLAYRGTQYTRYATYADTIIDVLVDAFRWLARE